MSMSLPVLALVAAIVLVSGAVLYHAALSKPIPGIPYHKSSARSIFGDIPAALRWHAETSEIGTFFRARCEEHNSPVAQIFMTPFGNPTVLIIDARESHDIMSRRSKEFDRANFFANLFRAAYPYNQVVMRSTDQWRHNRRLVADTMAPTFLHTVAAPQVYATTRDLVALWRQKQRLAGGAPFDVREDVCQSTIDTIWMATFGTDLGIAATQTAFLTSLDAVPRPGTDDELVVIPTTDPPEAYTAITTIAATSEIAFHSPFGWLHHWVALRLVTRLRRAVSLKNRLVDEQIRLAWEIYGSNAEGKDSKGARSAAELVVEREVALARKEIRAPKHDSVYVKDELAGFLNAGFGTTSATLSWGLKYLTAHQDVQSKLRQTLRTTFQDEFQAGKEPEAEGLAKTSIPYLEAFIEETLRVSAIVPISIRMTVSNAEIFGRLIPKGTDVMMLLNGPSMHANPILAAGNKRSRSSREAKETTGRRQQPDLDTFNPDRWLITKEDSAIQYDSRAAPQQVFGVGPRSCFGRDLAYVEMQIIYSLIVWNFELQPLPPSLVDDKGFDELTHHPRNVRVRLGEA